MWLRACRMPHGEPVLQHTLARRQCHARGCMAARICLKAEGQGADVSTGTAQDRAQGSAQLCRLHILLNPILTRPRARRTPRGLPTLRRTRCRGTRRWSRQRRSSRACAWRCWGPRWMAATSTCCTSVRCALLHKAGPSLKCGVMQAAVRSPLCDVDLLHIGAASCSGTSVKCGVMGAAVWRTLRDVDLLHNGAVCCCWGTSVKRGVMGAAVKSSLRDVGLLHIGAACSARVSL